MTDSQASQLPPEPWSAGTRIAFRFASIYLVLYNAGPVCELLPWLGEKLGTWVDWPIGKLAAWLGIHLFHLTGDAAARHPTGSGDTAQDYLTILVVLVLAILGAALWTAIDERRQRPHSYPLAYAWLRLDVRFVLAATLLSYGWVKVFPMQFSSPGINTLLETYGDASPMGLLWTFMGASTPYEIFAGSLEVLAGSLLLFRRTSTVGALLGAGVLANIVMLNLCYDVPVKLYSSHLLAMAVFLLLPDMPPMWRFFILRRESTLHGVWLPRWERRPLRLASHILQTAVLLGLAWSAFTTYQGYKPPVKSGDLRGAWAATNATGWTDKVNWAHITVDTPGYLATRGPEDRPTWHALADSKQPGVLILKGYEQTPLHWTRQPDGIVRLTGSFEGTPLDITMHRIDPDKFPLQSRGFHWVSEYPYNR